METFWQFVGHNSGALGLLIAAGGLIYKMAEAKPEQHAKVRGWFFQALDRFFAYALPAGLFLYSLVAIWQFVTRDGPMTRVEVFSVAVMVSVVIHMAFFSPLQLTQRRREKYASEALAQRVRQIEDLTETIKRTNDRLDRLTDVKRPRI